ELYAWLFMRASGLVLVLLALGHLFIMHVFNSIHSIDYDFVAARYMRNFWRVYDLAMLWLALIHGLNGLRTITDDYLKPPARDAVSKLIWMGGIAFLVLGTWAILGFNAASGGGM
ncbi:MAG: succinate dehydrogenase, partial [Candidatus Omnitrophica bacterium]|nr:succinate dehydrogenase [Candidatus Omnitrophota bacterium]